MNNIVIEFIGAGFRVHLKDHQEVEGFGATKQEAVGDLILKNPQAVKLQVTDNTEI